MDRTKYEYLGYEKFNEHHPLKNILLKLIKKEPVLDVGCGNGVLLRDLKHLDIEGFDISEEAIKEANEMGTYNVSVSSIKDFNSEKKYGTIIFVGMLILLKDPIQDIKTMMKFLKEDGELIITAPNSKSLKDMFGRKKDQTHLFTTSYNDFNEILEENNFNVKKIIGAGKLKYFPRLSGTNLYVIKK